MRRIVPVLLILALISCKREEAALSRAANQPSTSTAAGAQRANEVKDSSAALQRMIIRSANISIIVDDTAATLAKITAAGEAVGGYVSDSRIWRDGEQLRGTVTLRIPSDKLSTALVVIRKMAVRINTETVGSQEVTQEYVDLESQLRNLEAAEVEIRQLMTTVRERSKKASEVLEMYQQLSNIRAQIEQIKGRMRYLSQMSAYASLQVDLVPNALAKPVVEPGWQPVVIVKDASRALVESLQTLAGISIWLGIYILPMVLLFGLAVLLGWKFLSRFIRRPESAV